MSRTSWSSAIASSSSDSEARRRVCRRHVAWRGTHVKKWTGTGRLENGSTAYVQKVWPVRCLLLGIVLPVLWHSPRIHPRHSTRTRRGSTIRIQGFDNWPLRQSYSLAKSARIASHWWHDLKMFYLKHMQSDEYNVSKRPRERTVQEEGRTRVPHHVPRLDRPKLGMATGRGSFCVRRPIVFNRDSACVMKRASMNRLSSCEQLSGTRRIHKT